jgi:elongation factor G
MGELHLDIKVDILKRTHGVEADVGKPQVAYRETITKAIDDSYTHKKQTGGSGQYAKIDYTIEPGEPGTGFVFESTVTGGNVPKEYIPSVEKGFKVMKDKGPLAGFPLLDFKVVLATAASTRSTPRRWPSRRRPRRPSGSRCPRRARSSSSRS